MWAQVIDDYNVIGRSLFKKETNIQLFVGLKVYLSTGELGVIDSAFGQSGKFKIHIPGEYGYFLLLVDAGKSWRDGRNSAPGSAPLAQGSRPACTDTQGPEPLVPPLCGWKASGS